LNGSPIRLALVGLGKIARDQHLPAVEGDARFMLAASVDPASPALDAVPHFASLQALLDSGLAFDAAAVCTPPQHRNDIALAALAAGKHVLLEKPPATTPAEVAALEERAEGAGLSLFAAWHSRFAAGVAPARAWLAGKAIHRVDIVWREDVRVWHPGQAWIWREGGFGVFDPGINALSIVTALLDRPLSLHRAALQVPTNCATPVAAQLGIVDAAGVPVSADLDFLQEGPQTWDIRIDTDGGELLLSRGGSVLRTPEGSVEAADCEYAAIYARFGELIRGGACDVDTAPLRLVDDALTQGSVTRVAAFHE
jgi:D-galactose 1-dehydrogenase